MVHLPAPERRAPALPQSVVLANRLRPLLLQLARHLRHKAGTGSVSAGQVEILALMERRPGVGVNDLAAMLGISAPSMSNALDKLETAGLAERSRGDTDDRRRVGLRVTARGSEVVREVRCSRNAWLAARIRQLDPEQRAALRAALDALEAIAAEGITG